MSQQSQIRYTLGSRQQWRQTLVLLVVPLLIASVLFWIFLQWLGIAFVSSMGVAFFFFLAALGVLLLNGFNLPDTVGIVPWLSDITVNLAYGWADEDGIHFRKWFCRRFVSWRGIARVEYWPDRHGRIDLYLYSQSSPVVFVAPHPRQEPARVIAAGESETVGYISWKLNQAWPGLSTFLISYENPQGKETGRVVRAFGNLTVPQKAFASASLMFLAVILSYGYVAIRIAYRQYFWEAAAVIWGFLLIAWFCLRLLRKSKKGSKRLKLEGLNSGSTRKLN